ncbi:MAG: FAD-dependent oxidoreductase, partial [Gammaproteobacteria bacterium]|nr:FAD-dependent oxidoreductase [Gammaproteobacteria bacterium]
MKPTDISDPNYFHKVVDCQWACPAHTPVPEYIRLIAEKRYTDAYMINWHSNVFPGILGRTCDRPCEPACRRGRVEEEPVAICRLKRVAADYKSDIANRLPQIPKEKNGRHIALIGGGPASLTVARDLMPLGYEITLFEKDKLSGGAMRTQIPRFRLPGEVLDEELNYILQMGVNCRFGEEITSMRAILDEGYDAIFVGTGAPLGKWLDLPGHDEAKDNIHTGIEWLASVAFEHISSIGKNVLVLGGGNTAMDCCRTSKRIGGEQVSVVVRSGFDEMKASPWEIEDAMNEDIPILNFHVPKRYITENGKLVAMEFEKVRKEIDADGKRRLVPTGEEPAILACDDVLCAIGQENSFPWIERDLGIEFDQWEVPVLNKSTFQSTHEKVFFGGDAALGPDNIITAVAHGHDAAVSIHMMCEKQDISKRP